MDPRLCPPACRTVLGSVRALFSRRNGAIGIEYGLIAALVAVVILGSIKALGLSLSGLPLAAIVAAL